MRPLELRFQRAAGPPIGVAEMVVDGGIFRLELDRTLELLHRLFVIADLVVRPAERVDDVAVVGTQSDRALDHVHSGVEVHALIDPGITEIVEDVRLLRIKLECLLQVGLGERPLLRALVANTAEIECHPVRFGRIWNERDRTRIRLATLLIFFVGAMDVAERLDCLDIIRPLREQSLQFLLGFFAALHRVEVAGHLDRRIAMQRRTGRHALVDP